MNEVHCRHCEKLFESHKDRCATDAWAVQRTTAPSRTHYDEITFIRLLGWFFTHPFAILGEGGLPRLVHLVVCRLWRAARHPHRTFLIVDRGARRRTGLGLIPVTVLIGSALTEVGWAIATLSR